MHVLLVRHGTATSPDLAPTDEMRWLTDSGRIGVRDVTRTLFDLGVRITRIYTSPLVRAVQTAEILATQTGFVGPVESLAPLSVDYGTTAQALRVLDGCADADVVALVTHEPKIRALAGHLVGMRGFPGFATGGAALFTWDGKHGAFGLMIDPERLTPATSIERIR